MSVDELKPPRSCRVCHCTDADCTQCIARTGERCHWVAEDLCSACVAIAEGHDAATGLAAQIAQQLDVNGVEVILLDGAGGLHTGVVTVEGPEGEPLLMLARGIHEAISRMGGPAIGSGLPPPLARCAHCKADIARLDDVQAITAHGEACEASPIARELQRLRAVELRARTIVQHWRAQDGFNAALIDELGEVVGG